MAQCDRRAGKLLRGLPAVYYKADIEQQQDSGILEAALREQLMCIMCCTPGLRGFGGDPQREAAAAAGAFGDCPIIRQPAGASAGHSG